MNEVEDQVKKDQERLMLKKFEKELNVKSPDDVDNLVGIIDDYIKSGKGEAKDMDNEFNKRFSDMEKSMKEMQESNNKLLKEQQKHLYKDRVLKLIEENKEVYPYLDMFNDKDTLIDEFVQARENVKDQTITDDKLLEFLNTRFKKVADSFNVAVKEEPKDENEERKEALQKKVDEKKVPAPEISEDEIQKYKKDDSIEGDERIPTSREAMRKSLQEIGIDE